MDKIQISIEDLEGMLNEQKRNVIDNLSGSSSYYNEESTDGHQKSLPIDKEKFYELGIKSRYPNDFNILKRYIKP